MRPRARTRCTATPMSELMPMSQARNRPRPAPLAHAGEVAQWVVLLLGWLWLGEQGMRLAWPLASGVLAVALWWTVRIVCRGMAPAWACSAPAIGALGGLTAAGVALLALPMPPAVAPLLLLLLASLWGLWCAVIDTRSQTSSFEQGRFAWHPLLAAALVFAAWPMAGSETGSVWGVCALLAMCAALLQANAAQGPARAKACGGPREDWPTLLAPSAMGLMMGSLWLGTDWCKGWGLSSAHMLQIHLLLMAGLPSLLAWCLHQMAPAGISKQARQGATLCLLFGGALMLLGDSAWHGALAMLMPSLAWALHCGRQRPPKAFSRHRLAWRLRRWALLLGPGLLVGVGLASPYQGPLAMQSALALLGALAVCAGLAWRRPAWSKPLKHPLSAP